MMMPGLTLARLSVIRSIDDVGRDAACKAE
jgi:hypothetical protein